MTTKQTEIAPEGAESFDNACINLLCRLENATAALGEDTGRDRIPESLAAGKRILVEFLDFAERRFSKRNESLFDQLREVYERTKSLEEEIRKKSWGGWRSLLGFRASEASTFEVTQKYQELGLDYAQLFREFAQRCQNRFASPDTRAGFSRSVELFVAELLARW